MMTLRSLLSTIIAITMTFPVPSWAINNELSLPNSNNAYYEKAEMEFSAGDYPAAVIHLKNALLEDPNNLSAHILLGKANLEQGFGTLAEEELKEAERLGADKTLILSDLARALMLQVKYREVIKRITPLGLSPKVDAGLLVYRGESYFQLGDSEKAVYEYNEARRTDPSNVDVYIGLATIELASENFKEAESLINQAVDIDHQNAGVWYAKGQLHHAQGDIANADIAYSTAININPDHFNSKLAKAGLLMDVNNFQQAKDAFSALYKDAPENPQVAYFLSVATAKVGDKSEAQRLMKEAKGNLELLPQEVINDHGPTLMLAGLIHYDLNEYQLAKSYLISFINRFPADFRARVMLGKIYNMEGAWQKTASILEPALEFNPRNYQLLLLLGDAYMKKKDYFKASQIFALAAELYPDDLNLQTKLGLNDLLRGQTEAGMNTLENVIELSDQAASAGFILVTNLLKKGDVEEALSIAKRLSVKSPNNPLISNLLATVQMEAGLTEDAKSTWQQLANQNPEYKPAKINLVKLSISQGNLTDAERGLALLLAEDPENPTYLYDAAQIHLRKNEIEEAEKRLTKALSEDPKNYKATELLVDIYLQTNEPGKAVKVASKLVSEHFEHAGSYYLLGRSQLAFGERLKARASLQKASQLAKFDSIFLKNIASLQAENEDLTAAIYSLNKYIQSHQKDAEAWAMLAEFAMALEREANIEKPVSQLRLLGFNALADRLLGDLSYQQLDYVSAQKYYRQALSRAPLPEVADRLFVAITAEKGMSEGAVFLSQWLQEYPQVHPIREILARAYVTTEQYEKAKSHLETLITEGWESPVTLMNTAFVYQKLGDSKAKPFAEKALAASPNNPFALDVLGWQLVAEQQYEKALTLLRDAYARDSLSVDIRYHLAYTLWKLDRATEAKSYLAGIDSDRVSKGAQGEIDQLFNILN